MEELIHLGYSPCPNDTFIFEALVTGRLRAGAVRFQEHLEDVETLNAWARRKTLDVTKVSIHALGHIREDYVLLRSGAALGRGCGPLIVSREKTTLDALAGRPVAVPGALTTAALLLRLAAPALWPTVSLMPFHEIMAAVRDRRVDAGVIIHESRFTYQDHGLVEILDLGRWWEDVAGMPLPLGGIVARRDLGKTRICSIEEALRQSVGYARARPSDSWEYVKRHAQETADDVVRAHIDLYVNSFSEWLGEEGEAAVRTILSMAERAGFIPPSAKSLFPEVSSPC